ncbi:hypothetical protein [Microbacterium suwonense]|uniref:Uncharacterized protein n=1 Tax=Microbacterium suwonense TaxID=683047 RepID=A0ABN6X5Q0_9MICO|nr:hypothetical protein [Microbacterium suwonense]BDZ39994.1 hypothetical protein GCM10025863_26080 [Microbacterium suwonense]
MSAFFRALWRRSSPGLFITSALTFLLILLIFIYPLLTDVDPLAQDIDNAFAAVGTPGHLLGTDNLGRDTLVRLAYGLRTGCSCARRGRCSQP